MTYLLNETFINTKNSKTIELNHLNARFSAAFESVTWFTYRDNIEMPLIGSKLQSDSGWGCMLRTGQMIMF